MKDIKGNHSMISEKIYNHVADYNKSQGWEESLDSVIETIRESKKVYSEETDSRRHWDLEFKVVEVNGMLIGFEQAYTTGDLTAEEKGWEFDPKSICEVNKKEVVVVKYYPIKD